MHVSCSKTDTQRRDQWAATNGLKPSPRRNGWHAFMGRPAGREFTDAALIDNPLRHGWDDHGEVWVSKRSIGRGFKHPVCYTSQPYDLSDDARANLATLATLHGLEVEVHPPEMSWYYPGSTWLIVITPTGSPLTGGPGFSRPLGQVTASIDREVI